MSFPRLSRIIGIIALVVVGFAVGVTTTVYSFRASSPTTLQAAILKLSPAPTNADFGQLLDVWNRLHTEYVNPNVNDRNLLQGALSGLVQGLGDPYSTFMSAADAKKFQDEISGTFEGVGMQVGYNKDNKVTVIAPLPKSPAETAGLQAGDVLLTVDGKDVSVLNLDQVVNAIRGQSGTIVTLTIQRGSDPQAKTFKVKRSTINVDSVTAKVTTVNGRRIAELAISSFNLDTGRELRAKAKTISASSLDGVLLDLRNNPGGYLDQAVDVASLFIPSGPVVAEVDRNGKRKTFDVVGQADLAPKKVVVLVNGGSASASEIVAGAMQDTAHGTIIGTQTFGKGSVQDYQTLADGSSLKLTVAKWLTPKGRSISDHGITPDIVVAMPTSTTDQDDPQRDRAWEILAPKP